MTKETYAELKAARIAAAAEPKLAPSPRRNRTSLRRHGFFKNRGHGGRLRRALIATNPWRLSAPLTGDTQLPATTTHAEAA